MTTFLPLVSMRPASKCGETDGAAGLDHQLQFPIGIGDRRADFLVGCDHALRQQLAVDREGEFARHRRHQRVADGAAGGVMGLAVAGAQRQAVVVIVLGLGDDDLSLRKLCLHRRRNAGDQPAARCRRHHDIGDEPERRHVLGDLTARGALPGDHERIVIGPHQRRAALRSNAVGDGFAVFLVAVVEHHLGAVALGALALGDGRVRRHHDGGLHAEDLRRRRHALGVIAGRERDHPAAALVLRDRGQLVEGAAELERSGPLQHFGLQKDLGPDAFIENGKRQQRRPHRERGNYLGRRIDIRSADRCNWGWFGHARL